MDKGSLFGRHPSESVRARRLVPYAYYTPKVSHLKMNSETSIFLFSRLEYGNPYTVSLSLD